MSNDMPERGMGCQSQFYFYFGVCSMYSLININIENLELEFNMNVQLKRFKSEILYKGQKLGTGSYQTTKYRTGQPWEVFTSNHNLWADYVQEDLDLLSGMLTYLIVTHGNRKGKGIPHTTLFGYSCSSPFNFLTVQIYESENMNSYSNSCKKSQYIHNKHFPNNIRLKNCSNT